MKRFFDSLTRPVPLFLILTLMGYGLLLPYTGFYWDDWPFAWIAEFLGPAEFIPAFTPFRPFLGPIFFLTTSLIPPIPIYWQCAALLIRFLIGLATLWTLHQLWPEKPRLSLAVASLVLVFPGYSQHWVAFTHINQELIPFLFYILSFGFTFKALHSQRPFPYTGIALLLQVCGLFPTEYFFGFEGLRALLLLLYYSGPIREKITYTLRRWWPHLFVWILNALWLIYYYRFGPYNSYEVTVASEFSWQRYLPEIADTLWKVCFYIWGQVVVLQNGSLQSPSTIFTLCLILTAFILLLTNKTAFKGRSESPSFALSLVLIGLMGILLGRLPSLAAGLPLRLQSSFDRLMVSMMLASSLYMVGLIEWILPFPVMRRIVLSALIALGVGQQFFNANIFRRDWENQKEIYWQLAWRVPGLQPDTLLLTHQMPIDYETDFSFTAPINWMYAPDFTPPKLPYALIYTEKRLGGTTLPALEPDVPVRFTYRTVHFNGTTSQTLVIFKPVNGCLRVLDPERGDAQLYSIESKFLTKAIPLSMPSRIFQYPEKPAAPVFVSSEPEHTWCFFFAKAELAHQAGGFEQVVELFEQAQAGGFSIQDPREGFIFIDAYVQLGKIESAMNLTNALLQEDNRLRNFACDFWTQALDKTSPENMDQLVQFVSGLDCPR
ncbi:MAG: hypothetical protein FJZ87_13810 [Chloroflexi bacterium]|nr:hypothetical protein [Chloroflexota bacterium]